jgi:hypothetical protein
MWSMKPNGAARKSNSTYSPGNHVFFQSKVRNYRKSHKKAPPLETHFRTTRSFFRWSADVLASRDESAAIALQYFPETLAAAAMCKVMVEKLLKQQKRVFGRMDSVQFRGQAWAATQFPPYLDPVALLPAGERAGRASLDALAAGQTFRLVYARMIVFLAQSDRCLFAGFDARFALRASRIRDNRPNSAD